MPHYKDGVLAAIGDVVKGPGYLKSNDGESKEIVGTVIGIMSEEKTCNLQLACVIIKEVERDYAAWANLYDFFSGKGVIGLGLNGGKSKNRVMTRVGLEYAQADNLEVICPVMRMCEFESKRIKLRPFVYGFTIMQEYQIELPYHLYRRGKAKDELITPSMMVEMNEGDQFYGVPPATGA
jgi:hypothetical protein